MSPYMLLYDMIFNITVVLVHPYSDPVQHADTLTVCYYITHCGDDGC